MTDIQQNRESTWVIHLGNTLRSEAAGLYLRGVQMRERPATVAKILLIAITLFCLGPQLGSLDIDGDGVPDVPVVVTHVSSYLNLDLRRDNGRSKIVPTRELPFWRLTRNDSRLFPTQLVIELRGYNSQLVDPLRC